MSEPTARPARPLATARTAIAAVTALGAILLAACGVPADGAPREIATEAMPPQVVPGETTSTTTTSSVPASSSLTEVVWVVQERDTSSQLHGIDVQVQANPPDALAKELIEKLIAERGEQLETQSATGLRNRIPSGTEVLSTQLVLGDVLVIDFSDDLREVEGDGLVQAMAQIVFTATEVNGVGSVRIKIEGEERSVTVEDGVSTENNVPVTRGHYPRLNDIVEAGSS